MRARPVARVTSALPSSIRHRVSIPVGLALLAVALLGGVAGLAVHQGNDTVQTEAQTRVRSNRDAAVRALLRQTDGLRLAVATSSMNGAVIESLKAPTPSSLGKAQDHLWTLASSHGSRAAFLSDTQGRTVASHPSTSEFLGKDYSSQDWFKGASQSGRPYVSACFVWPADGHPLVVGVAAPVFDGSRRVGFITLLWGLESVRAMADGSHRDDDVEIAVTDQRGQPLTGTLILDDSGQPQQAAPSTMTKQALAGRLVSSVNAGMIEAAAPVPGIGWTVTAAMPSSVALASTGSFRRGLEVTLGVALLLVILALVFAWRVAQRRGAERIKRQTAETALRASEERFRRLFDEALHSKLLVNNAGDIIRVNGTLCRLLGRDPAWFEGQPLVARIKDAADQLRILDLVEAGEGELRAEMALSDPGGRSLWGLVALSWMHELCGESVLLVQVEDVTARRAAERRLTELTLHDELTGLPNRRLLVERCEGAFARARSGRSDSSKIAAFFIDLDGFKPINDGAGHDVGDQVLVAVANDLVAALRPTDTVARVGGDEFVVLLEDDGGLDYLGSIAGRITALVRRQVVTDRGPLTLSASVGIGRVDLSCEPEVSPEQLLRRADAAMYRAKERGRDRFDVFDSDLSERTEARQELAQAVRDGLRDDRVALVFQPVVDVDSNIVVGAEALMRLRNAEGRLLPTLPAIIAAEAAGLAEAFGDRVLDLALGAARTWPEHMTLAVNISAREFTGRDLHSRIDQALRRHDFDPARLVLEITESSILSAGPSALAELEQLRQRGIRVAIDDFGTAYATLENLTLLPVDLLKVDTTFTAGLPHQRTHTAIVHGIASMAFELGIPCIVEGVETDEQLEAIRGMSVLAQGWLWGKPQGAESIPRLTPVTLP